VAPDSGFVDVPDRAANAVNVLKELGVIHGKTETTFGSHDPLTRAEMAKIIASAYDLKTEGKAHPFKDVSPAFTDYVKAVYHAGITVGKGETTYGSSDLTKRGEFAVFLKKADQYEEVVPDVVVSEVTGVVNEDNTVTITGKATEIDKVTVVIPNGDKEISIESNVVDGKFSITTQMPQSGIYEISVLAADGKILYEGVTDKVVTASIEKFTVSSVN
jgi:S-layer homology domain